MVTDINRTPELLSRLEQFAVLEEVIGIFGDEAKVPHPGTELTMVELAAIHEYGTRNGHVPARPWISVGTDRARSLVGTVIQAGIQQVLEGGTTAGQVLDRAGLAIKGSIQKYASSPSSPPPPLALSTIKAKGSANPLVDTGRMIQAVQNDHRPREGERK